MDLPGAEMVRPGLEDLAAGRETEAGLLVAVAAPRLRALGYTVPARGGRSPRTGCMSCWPGRRERTVATTR